MGKDEHRAMKECNQRLKGRNLEDMLEKSQRAFHPVLLCQIKFNMCEINNLNYILVYILGHM